MSEPARQPKSRFRRWLQRVAFLIVVVSIVIAAGTYYARSHLAELVITLVHRKAPGWKLSIERAAFSGFHRLEIRGLSLKSRREGSELLRLDSVSIDFTLAGLRHRRIDSIVVDDPVLLVDDALLKQLAAESSSEKKEASEPPWRLGKFNIRNGKARLDLSRRPLVEFEFSNEPRMERQGESELAVNRLELRKINITGRDRAAPVRARIKSAVARFALEEIARGHLRELIVQSPSLRLTPEVRNLLGQEANARDSNSKSTLPDFRVDHLLIDRGDLRMDGFGAGVPDAAFKFGLETNDVRLGDAAEKLHHAQLWEIALWSPSPRARQFLTIDSAQVDFALAGLLTRKELAGVFVTGMMFQVGDEFRSMVAQTPSDVAAPAVTQADEKPWLIRNLQIHGSHVTIADLGVEIPSIQFDLNTTINDVPLSSDLRFASEEIQKVEFADLTLHSPLDPFAPVVNFKTVFLNFSFAHIMRREIDALILLNPTIFVGPDLFWYVDQLKKRQAEAAPLTNAAASAGTDPGWQLQKFEAAYGQLVIAVEGQPSVPLPLSFSTQAENIRFSNFNDLQLKLNLLIPTADYPYPSYELEFKQLGGEIRFGLPPEKEANNLVQTLRASEVRWKQFVGEKLFWSVTYDEKGIYGNFGGASYGGYVNGQFSFFLQPGSPWQGWISGSKVNLGQLTDVIAPENFHMTGPADFKMTVKALSTDIQQVKGNLKTRTAGHLKIAKLDDLLAKIPSEWGSIKKGATRIGLETLRDFDYESGDGDFSFVGRKGKLTLLLRGPHGSRNFDVVLH